jgi:3D (Asp-Asp-Asp) domain-containing protein
VCIALFAVGPPFGCARPRPPSVSAGPAGAARELTVTATAYNSLEGQGDGDPERTASGLRLQPGMRVLAVSDDLYAAGLGFGTRVRIDGVPGEWHVADRMHPRWQRKIDLYMGEDERAALRFGRRQVRIRWSAPQ